MKILSYSLIASAALVLCACSTAPPATPAATMAPAPTASSTTAAPAKATAPSQNLVDASAVQALKDMGSSLQALRRYELMLDSTGERVLSDGQKLTHSATADLQVALPNRIKADMNTAASHRVLSYDGKKVSLLFPDSKYYSTVDFSGTVGELIEKLRTGYGVDFPAADLFVWGTPAAPFDNLQSAMNAGQALVGNTVCDHYAFRQAGIDWQIWLSTGANPLPMKLVITDLTDEARPQSASVFHWNLKPAFKDASFTFVPPRDAKAIDMAPAKNTQR